MPDRSRTIVLCMIAFAALAAVALGARSHGPLAAGAPAGRMHDLTAAERAATLRFDPAVSEYDRGIVLQAIADARPEAQRLIGLVDGLAVVHVAVTVAGSVGTTSWTGRQFDVSLNLGAVARRFGRRGLDRLVLHELGHVVDFALVPEDLDRRLDAAIPRGFGCDEGLTGGCAMREERFAESFAKWATRDIGVDLDFGYKVPPPDSLEDWGAPLAGLSS